MSFPRFTVRGFKPPREAVVAALREMEPETTGWDQLLAAFSEMIDRQVPYLQARRGPRVCKRKRTTQKNIPSPLLGDLSRVVVAYGESAPRKPGRERDVRPPLMKRCMRADDDQPAGPRQSAVSDQNSSRATN